MLEKKVLTRTAFLFISIFSIVNSGLLYILKEKQAAQLSAIQNNREWEQDEVQHNAHLENSVSFASALNNSRNELTKWQNKVRLLQLKCDFSALLEEKSNEDESPYAVYEKYLRLRQGEMARIDGVEDLSEWGKFGYLNGHFSGATVPVNEGMMLQYGGNPENVWEYLLPGCVIITAPDMGFGFMSARAGMDFEEIQQNAYDAEVKKGFMYWSEQEVYYIEYTDAYYCYTFISDYPDGRDSWLLVSSVNLD